MIPWPEHVVARELRVGDDATSRSRAGSLNSAIVAAGDDGRSGVFLACTAGYAFSRFRFPGGARG